MTVDHRVVKLDDGRSRRRALALGLLAVIVLVAGVYGVQAWRHWERHVSTDAAFVEDGEFDYADIAFKAVIVEG